MARVNVFIDVELLAAVDREARQAGLRRSALVQRAMREYLESVSRRKELEERRRQQAEASARLDRLAERLGSWDPVKTVREGRERRSRSRARKG
jgi:metal-responsive CopG/Arc/MetJ family transcriptional regulator